MSVITNAPVATGEYVSAGAQLIIPLQPSITKFEVYSLTKLNAAVAFVGQELYSAKYVSGMSAGFAVRTRNNAGAFTLVDDVIQSAGFTIYDSVNPQTFASASLAAVGSISLANPAVVTTALAHGLATGDIVRLWSVANLNVLNGLTFVVTVTGPTTFTIPVDTTAQSAPGAGGFWQRIIPPVEWVPEARIITGISQAASAVVTTSVPHGYQIGGIVRLNVPANFGMSQINGQLATITALPSANSFTVNINSSGYSAFAFPQQAPAFASTYAQSVPVAEVNSSFLSAQANLATKGIILGTSVVGAVGDEMRWIAYSGLSV